ncbi:hypothetical protein J6590_088383 [Homalodisca vitripennis]|nr:hypothetical protein J6590_088383 [Homalodisca vitripennis]
MRRDAFSSVVARRCSGHIGAPANCTARVERFPNLKSTPSNGMTSTTIDEKNKSTHLLVKIKVFSFKKKRKKTGYKIEPLHYVMMKAISTHEGVASLKIVDDYGLT